MTSAEELIRFCCLAHEAQHDGGAEPTERADVYRRMVQAAVDHIAGRQARIQKHWDKLGPGGH